jgi:uncharacterized repeat protein (TIGR03943 family)
MRRETANVLLVLLGGALLKIALNGSYLRYVKPTVFPWLVTSGVVILLLAAVAIVRDAVGWSSTRRDQHAETGQHGDDHQPRSPWLLVLPVLAIFLVAPPALGADTVTRAGDRSVANQQKSGQQKSGSLFEPLPAEGVVPLRMSDFVTRAVWDDAGSVNNRTVKLTGFVVHDGGTVYLARLVINCCAADAMPVKVKLDGSTIPGNAIQGDVMRGLKDDQWLAVTGRLQPKTATKSNGYTPSFTVSGLAPVPAPADPYEY